MVSCRHEPYGGRISDFTGRIFSASERPTGDVLAYVMKDEDEGRRFDEQALARMRGTLW